MASNQQTQSDTLSEAMQFVGLPTNYPSSQYIPSNLQASFTKQPPENVRKLSIFPFDVAFFFKQTQRPLAVLNTQFLGFLAESFPSDPHCNGLHYSVKYQDNFTKETFTEYLYLRMVDSARRTPIKFEGIDRNPQARHVILPHESNCNRCQAKQKCTIEKGAPACPLVVNPNTLRFFLRCNQNCVKGIGAPAKGDQRRFCLEVSNQAPILAYSEPFFVHNSSKYGRQTGTTAKKLPQQEPSVSSAPFAADSQFARLVSLVLGPETNYSSTLDKEEICKKAADMIEQNASQLSTPNFSFEQRFAHWTSSPYGMPSYGPFINRSNFIQ